ncbi:MAG: molybdopterin-dependent oxidoreductase [Candidatus Competibacteraceae bacterium]
MSTSIHCKSPKDATAVGKAPNAYLAEVSRPARSISLRGSGQSGQLPAQPIRLALQLARSSGKGHSTSSNISSARCMVQGKDLGREGSEKPLEVKWRRARKGKLDLLVTLDFHALSTTCMYSDIVLPTATWYEKNDLNTSDMHPFIHPLSTAVDPAWESRTDWDIFKGIAKAFSETCRSSRRGKTSLPCRPLHDTPSELAMPDVKDWKKGECELIPGKTAPSLVVVERDYPNTYQKFTSVGPLLDKVGNGGKGITWNTEHEVEALATLNYTVLEEGVSKGRPRIDSDIDAAEMIMMLAPETNGHVAVKAWAALSKITGRDHTHLAIPKEHEKIRFRDIQAQPRKIISSPTWSGLEDEKVSYNAGYTNVHELIPWRTLTGRQQFYQDHPWMLGFGEAMCAYRPPVDMKTVEPIIGQKPNGNKEIVLNFITPHQKWGIHSTYTDNLLMLTLSRGGPIIWMSEIDAKKAGIEDNDWIEAYNLNGAIAARAVVSQRVPEGMSMMYHAQEKIVNTPGSEITGTRGGIHNSVTRTVLKPTHMIGGYAQQSYGFNYYGTVGANRDEFIIVRKMAKVDWLDDETPDNATVEAH